MKKKLITVFLTLPFLISYAINKPIVAKVFFKNLTEKQLNSGEFIVVETGQKIEINNTKSFEIKLPKSGKYSFKFSTDDFTVYTYYPSRITKKKNVIIILLVEKNTVNVKNGTFSVPLYSDTKLSDKEIEEKIKARALNFILHGLNNSQRTEFSSFKKEYGIGFVTENCVVDPLSFSKAINNNIMITEYLNKKYDKNWQKEIANKTFWNKIRDF